MKRIFLFVLTNIAVMAVVGIITSLFGLGRYTGTNTAQLMVFSLVVGFAGSIISLLMSMATNPKVMGPHTIGRRVRWLGWAATALMAVTVLGMFVA